jgi:Tfp pilus assembly protein PilV
MEDKNTTANLILALTILALLGVQVTAIQFEDGSGTKFNVQVIGSNRWEYYDLSEKMHHLINPKRANVL